MTNKNNQKLPFFPWLLEGLLESLKRFGLWLLEIVITIGKAFLNIGIFAYKGVIAIGKGIYRWAKRMIETFTKGDWKTRLSYAVFGSGYFLRGQIIKGILHLVLQVAFFVFLLMPNGGWFWARKLLTLGDVVTHVQTGDECQLDNFGNPVCHTVLGDNSMLILLYGLATVFIAIGFWLIYNSQIKGAYKNQLLLKEGKKLPNFKQEVVELLDHRFHVTILSIPTVTIFTFTVLPLVFMILLAFTNFNKDNQPPGNLFSWTGFDTFGNLFGGVGYSTAITSIIQWTFVWAFFATFSNYIAGMIVALMINKKGIKLKKLWRTVFVLTIAIPQFVTLMLMRRLLDDNGPLNAQLKAWGWIEQSIRFLSTKENARLTVILINMWVGVPYTMLVTSGILMNIPADLYESARIDGASPFTQFWKITLPYMLFVTGPYLITAFIGNINNFNVIFFLTGGGPANTATGGLFGDTDLLVTWLYSLTVGGARQEYAIGSALGILIFIISAFISLVLYSRTAASQREDEFQ